MITLGLGLIAALVELYNQNVATEALDSPMLITCKPPYCKSYPTMPSGVCPDLLMLISNRVVPPAGTDAEVDACTDAAVKFSLPF